VPSTPFVSISIAFPGGRAFSLEPRCTEASRRVLDTQALVRRARFESEDLAGPLRGNITSPSQRRFGTQNSKRRFSSERDNVAGPRGGNNSVLPKELAHTITEEEYNKWLRGPLRPSYPNHLCGIKLECPQAEQQEARLPEHLRRDPLSAFTDGPDALNLSITTAGDCIQLYINRLLEQILGDDELVRRLRAGKLGWDELRKNIDHDEFRRRLAHDNAGTKAVLWLLNSARHEDSEVSYDVRFVQASALCVLGEGKSDVWWDMIMIQHAPKPLGDASRQNTRYSRDRWQGVLLTSLFQAEMFWTTEGSIWNGPLTSFQKVVRLNDSRMRARGGQPISLLGAYTFFSTKFPTYASAEDRQNMNIEDLDAFIS